MHSYIYKRESCIQLKNKRKQNIIIIIKTNNEISALPFTHYHHHLR